MEKVLMCCCMPCAGAAPLVLRLTFPRKPLNLHALEKQQGTSSSDVLAFLCRRAAYRLAVPQEAAVPDALEGWQGAPGGAGRELCTAETSTPSCVPMPWLMSTLQACPHVHNLHLTLLSTMAWKHDF